jgi:hypothetical protein
MTEEGYLHNGRIVYSVQYQLVGGTSIIVWFDRAGNDCNGGVCHSDAERWIVTAKPGDILYEGQPRTVVSLEPYGQNWLSAEDRAKYSRRELQPAEEPFI